MSPFSSIGIRVVEAAKQRQKQDLEVEQQRPVLDVVEIIADPLLDRRIAAQPVHLRPPRHARPYLVAEHVIGDLLAELVDEHGPLGTRADEAHLPAHHVEKLWQLVEREPAQPRAEARSAWIP